MGLFGSTTYLRGIFSGFTDWHSHILPGVDDGFADMELSLRILEEYEKAGIRTLWLTPHVMEDIPNTTAALRQRFTDLQVAYRGPVSLHLASENMLDSLFEERLESGDLLPLEGRRLLVETSFYNPPYNMRELLSRTLSKGWYPVLAHPERYMYMSRDDYQAYKDMGVEFQLNLPSLTGHYGVQAQQSAQKLLELGYYDYCGTDLHREKVFVELLEGRVKDKYFRRLPLK